MILFAISGYAQLPQEGFETWPAAGWHVYNDITSAPESEVTWDQSSGSGIQAGCGGTYAAYLDSENLPADTNGRPIDWLISKQFPVPSNPILRFCTKLTREQGQGVEFDIRISENADQMAYGNYVSLIDNSTGTFPLSENALMANESHVAYITKTINIPASYAGKSCYIAFVMKGVLSNGDRWLIDNVSVDTRCTTPTVANPVMTNPRTNGATLHWVNTSGATVHEIQVVPAAGTLGPTGTIVTATNSVVWPSGGAPDLDPDTDYKFYVRSVCSPTNPSDWAGPYNFSTVPFGARCEDPIVIGTLPFLANNNTANFADFYENAPGTSCNGGGSALNGNDVVYKYTATFTGPININLSNNGTNSGMFVYTSCTNIGVSCAAGGVGNGTPINLNNFNVTSGQDYFIVISTAGLTPSTPYTLIVQAASCAAPSQTTAPSNIGPHSATLSWAANAPGITKWEIVVQPAGSGIPPGAGEETTVNTNFLADELFEATIYEYWVRNDCNNGTFSAWAGPYTFTTLQVPAVLTYDQDFESVPTGFSLVNGTQANRWVVGTATHNGGTKSLYVSNDNGVTNSYNAATTSTVHAYKDVAIPVGAYEISLSFDLKVGGEPNDHLRVWLVPDNFTLNAGQRVNAVPNQRIKISGDLTSNTGWTNNQFTINVSQFAGTTRRIVFEWYNNATVAAPPPAAVDNINIRLITCSQPTGLAAADATQNGATFTWVAPPSNAVSYDYYYSTSNTPPTDTTAINGNTASLTTTPSDMLDNTMYYFWVRTVCSDANGKSFWTGPVAVMTTQIPAILTYNQDFEAASSGFTFINGTYANKWVVANGTSNGGTKSLHITNGTTAYDYTNSVNTPAVFAYRDFAIPTTLPINNQIEISFDWKGEGDANDYLKVWIVPTSYNPVAGTAITAAADRQPVGAIFNLNSTWTSVYYNIDIDPSYLGQNRRLVFEWRNNATGGIQPPAAVDNLRIKVLTCPSPSPITLGVVTANSAILTWLPTVPVPAAYDYYVTTNISNVPVDATTPTGSVTLPTVTLDDELAGSTNFYFWVRSNCGTGDFGRWIGPLQFGLPQVSTTLNYADNLEGNIGWTVVNGTQANKWVVGSAVSSSASTSLYVSNNNGQGNNYTIASTSTVHAYRDVQMTAAPSDISVSFQWKGGGEGTNDRLRVWSVPSDFNPAAGSQITALANSRFLLGTFSQSNNVWKNESIVVPTMDFAGLTRRIVFEWANNGSLGTQPAMAIDNINFRIITCPAVTNLTTNGGAFIGQVLLGWTPVGTETQWEVVIQVQGTGLPGDNPPTVITVNGTPQYTFTAPAGVFYEYYVRPVCAPDDKGLWAGPKLFSVFAPPACAKVDLYDEELEVVAPGTNFSICPGEDACVDLTADYLETGNTLSYAVEEIDYTPQFPFTGGIEMNVTRDDRWAPVETLPADFKFCFYGQRQLKYQVGSNGVVSFNTNFTPGINGDTCDYTMGTQNIPNTGTDFSIKNAIYGVYQDIDVSIDNAIANPSVNYQILGTYPCRAVVVSFNEVAQFGSSCNNNAAVGAQTSQIVFYEISNIIEVYVKRRVPCSSWEGGRGVIGIQNATGTAGIAAPGANVQNSNWTMENKAFRFTPNGPSNVQFGWYEGPNLLSTDDNISVCVTDQPRTVVARATYSACGSDTTVIETPVTITPEQPIIVTQTTDLLECPVTGTTATFDLMDGIDGGVANPENYTFTFYDTQAKADVGLAGTELPVSYTTGTTTIWVRIQLTGRSCYTVDSFEVTVKQAPIFDFPADFTICQGTSATIAITNANFDVAGSNVSIVWNSGALPDTGSSISVNTAGTYTVTVNYDGCIVTKSVNVSVTPLPTPDAPADVTVCDSYTLPALSADNNYYTAPGGPAGGGTMLNATDVITQTQTLYVFVQGATPDCFADNSFIVTIETAPVLTPINDVTACQSYTLPNLAEGAYYDSPGGTGTMLPVGTEINATQQIYVYAASATVPCISEISFMVNITPAITADNPADEIACERFELEPLSPNNSYYTAPNGPNGTGQMIPAGTFIESSQTIYVYAQQGTCTAEESFIVTIVPKPLPVAIDGGCQGGQFVLKALFNASDPNYNAGNVTFAWSRTEGGDVIGTTASIVAEQSGDYYLTVAPVGSSVSCSVTASIDVDDNNCIIQKGISPNNDGLNDNFDLTAYDVTNISIFNRYGKEVYSAGAYTNQWHGQGKGGDELPTGTYFYSYKRATGEEVTGWIYINREEN